MREESSLPFLLSGSGGQDVGDHTEHTGAAGTREGLARPGDRGCGGHADDAEIHKPTSLYDRPVIRLFYFCEAGHQKSSKKSVFLTLPDISKQLTPWQQQWPEACCPRPLFCRPLPERCWWVFTPGAPSSRASFLNLPPLGLPHL